MTPWVRAALMSWTETGLTVPKTGPTTRHECHLKTMANRPRHSGSFAMLGGMGDIGEALWNTAVGASGYSEDRERYQQAILEQYKLCVEMADRVSARRSLTNTFFLSLNSAVVAVVLAVQGGASIEVSVWLCWQG
jgi:hypothetical protein